MRYEVIKHGITYAPNVKKDATYQHQGYYSPNLNKRTPYYFIGAQIKIYDKNKNGTRRVPTINYNFSDNKNDSFVSGTGKYLDAKPYMINDLSSIEKFIKQQNDPNAWGGIPGSYIPDSEIKKAASYIRRLIVDYSKNYPEFLAHSYTVSYPGDELYHRGVHGGRSMKNVVKHSLFDVVYNKEDYLAHHSIL